MPTDKPFYLLRDEALEAEIHGEIEALDAIRNTLKNKPTIKIDASVGFTTEVKRTPQEQAVYEVNLAKDAKSLELAASGLNYRKSQRKKAQKPRQLKNNENEPFDDKVKELVLLYEDYSAKELWPHLITAIEEWSQGECREGKPTNVMDSWRVNFAKDDGKKRTITFQTFRKKVNKIRAGK